MNLSDNYARCIGTIRQKCANCRRRDKGRTEFVWYVDPAVNEAGYCHNAIYDEKKQNAQDSTD